MALSTSDSVSVTSLTTDNQEDPLQDLSDEQVAQLLDETLRANDVLQAETQMFEKYLKRVEPKDMPGQ